MLKRKMKKKASPANKKMLDSVTPAEIKATRNVMRYEQTPEFRKKQERAKRNNANESPILSGKGKKKVNKWIEHVKAYQQKHGCSYKTAMKESKASYKK